MSVCIPVLGVFRSGTSAVAAVLHALGVYMGENFRLMPADWNGTHSDLDFADLHSRLFYTAETIRYGMEPSEPEHLPAWYDLIASRENTHALWGVKEHWLIPLWPSFAARVSARPIVTWRCPDESIKSLAARRGCGYVEARVQLEPWLNALEQLKSETVHLEVRYPDLIAEPAVQVGRIADYVGLPINAEAVAAVRPELARFTD